MPLAARKGVVYGFSGIILVRVKGLRGLFILCESAEDYLPVRISYGRAINTSCFIVQGN